MKFMLAAVTLLLCFFRVVCYGLGPRSFGALPHDGLLFPRGSSSRWQSDVSAFQRSGMKDFFTLRIGFAPLGRCFSAPALLFSGGPPCVF
jgi:hypothetical protein